MNLLYCFILLNLTVLSAKAQTTYFQQNFDTGNPISQYINSGSPGIGQFNGIAGPSGSATIVNGTLQFDRQTDKTTGHFSRTTDLTPTPTSLYIQFDFEVVSATTLAGNSCLLFYVGNSFSNGVSNPSNADTYARFGMVFTGVGYGFAVRNIPSGGGGGNSATFTGKQTLTLVLNNTGYTITYLQPGGGTKKLSDDHYDLWVGTNRVFSDQPVLTPGQSMTDFKLRIDDDVYAATFQFDNFLMRDVSGALPVDLLQFGGFVQGSQVRLSWQTTTSEADRLFAVERRTATGEFTELGTSISGNTFTDEHPANGLNYYRLRYTDHDGSTNWSKLISVRYKPDQPALVVFDNPISSDHIRIRTYAFDEPTYWLTTLTGQVLPCQQRETPDGEVTLQPQHPLPSGLYLLTVTNGTTRLTRRVLIQ